jgi:hypothetical protein
MRGRKLNSYYFGAATLTTLYLFVVTLHLFFITIASTSELAFSKFLPKTVKSNPRQYQSLPVHRHVWLTKHIHRV